MMTCPATLSVSVKNTFIDVDSVGDAGVRRRIRSLSLPRPCVEESRLESDSDTDPDAANFRDDSPDLFGSYSVSLQKFNPRSRSVGPQTKLRTQAPAFAPERAIGEREVLAARAALLRTGFVSSVQLSVEGEDEPVTRMEATIADSSNVQAVVAMAQATLHAAFAQSSSCCLLGQGWQPFQGKGSEFSATFVRVSPDDELCWDMLQQGCCTRACPWRHPQKSETMRFTFSLQLPTVYHSELEPEQEPAVAKRGKDEAPTKQCTQAARVGGQSAAQLESPVVPASLFTPASLRRVSTEPAPAPRWTDISDSEEEAPEEVSQKPRRRTRGRRGARKSAASKRDKAEQEAWRQPAASPSDDEMRWTLAGSQSVSQGSGVPSSFLRPTALRKVSPEGTRSPVSTKLTYRFACPLTSGGWVM